MGRVFLSPRMGVRAASERWRRAGRSLRAGDRAALDRLAALAMVGASEGFYAFDEPLEASLVPVMAGLAARRGSLGSSGSAPPPDPPFSAPRSETEAILRSGTGAFGTARCGVRLRPGA